MKNLYNFKLALGGGKGCNQTAMPKKSFTVYFAGELFNAKHLAGNAILAEAIHEVSKGKFVPVLPQNIELRDTASHAIRDADIKALLECDTALFNYDGTELDSGTVVEFMFAKFADIPSVIIRTDFRKSGDQDTDPWNLMSSFYPRTAVAAFDAAALYRKGLGKLRGGHGGTLVQRQGRKASLSMSAQIARECVRLLDKVVREKPVLPPADRESVYRWLALAPAFRGSPQKHLVEMAKILRDKSDKGLL